MPTTLAGMSAKTNILRCLAHSPIELRANSNEGGDNRARVAGVINSGGAIKDFFRPFVLDMASIQVADNLPILYQHDHRKVIGKATEVRNDGQSLNLASGYLLDDIDETAAEIRDKAQAGIAYQMSPGIYDFNVERIEAGNDVNVNGRTFHGPIDIYRNGVVREVSIVILGADADTSAVLLSLDGESNQPQQSEGDMPDNTQAMERLQAEVAELKQQLEAATKERDAAKQQLEAQKKMARLTAVRDLFKQLGRDISDDGVKPYLEMSDEHFEALRKDMLELRAKPEHAKSELPASLFTETATDGDVTKSGQGSAKFNLNVIDIYAKRRNA